MKVLIRKALPNDLSSVLAIENECFLESAWAAEDFEQGICVVAEFEGEIVGFMLSRELFPQNAATPAEREILNLAVRPSFRRRGIAKALLRNELNSNASFFLEVRESNTPARSLYRQLGFKEVGRRAAYYDCPVETAIVMQLE